jgi:hypothetical protein
MPLPGGDADKLGNRYELWWTVAQLERMLHGEIGSIRIEDPGVDKAEFVAHLSGHRELHQAKHSHPAGKWSLASLAGADVQVLQAIYAQLRGNQDEFVFVSRSDAGELAELALRARGAETPQELEAIFLQAHGPHENLDRLRRAWDSCDDATLWDILRRIQVRSLDEQSLTERVRIGAQALFLANPDDVCSVLRAVALDAVHQTISRDDLTEELKKRGFVLRRLTDGAQAAAVITEATTRYLDGTRRRLIRHVLLHRAATDTLLSKLGTEAGDSVITGRAGTGKTACIVDFVEQLQARGIPVLVFRLDRIEPVSNAVELGKKLGFEESPALILASAAQGREAVLIVDQLDAVSTTSGRATSFLEAVEGLLIEARGLRDRLPLHVVVACREFDWRNDHRLRGLLPQHHTEVAVVEFALEEVKRLLTDAGFDVAAFKERQLELLRLPQNLSLFLESGFDPGRPPTFSTVIEMFDRYWDQKQRAVAQRAAPVADTWAEVIRVLVDEMAASQQLSVPREKLDHVPFGYLEQMASEGVLSFDGRRYGFGHESFFDYCFARSYFRKDQSLVSFLTSSEQHLFRRGQIRQVLAYLRDADRVRYLRELRAIVTEQRIRPHLKDSTLALLANVPEPSDEEWSIWEELLGPFFDALRADRTCDDKLSNLAWRHFFPSISWFGYANERGLVAKWLATEGGTVNAAMQYVRLHERHAPDAVVELLEPYVGKGGEWSARLGYVVQWSDQMGTRRYFDFVLRLIDDGTLDEARGPIAVNSTFWSLFYTVGKKRPEWIPEVLAHWLRRRAAIAKSEGRALGRDEVFGHDQFADEPIGEGAEKAPGRFVEHVLPAVLEISDAATDPTQDTPKRDAVWPYTFKYAHHAGPIDASFEGLMKALSALAIDAVVDLKDVISELRRRETHLSNFLLLTVYTAGGARFADEAAAVLCEQPWRLKCGFTDSTYWTAMEAIRSIVPHCSADSRARLEKTILEYAPAFERTPDGYKHAGHARFTLLSTIPSGQRSRNANARYEELERKFGKPDEAPRGITGGIVGSPIESKAADRMTDDQWLGAMAKYHSEHRDFRRVDDALRGGAIELARQLQTYVEKEPERFARLAQRFSADTNCVYFDHVLYGLKKAAIPSELKLEVCRKVYADYREKCGGPIAQLLGAFEDPLPDDAVAMLDWLATQHPDPDKELWQITASGGTPYYGGRIYDNGINTTRGQAVGAIGDLILKDSAYIKRFDATLAHMVEDPSASVRSCVAWTLRAVAHHSIPVAMSLLSRMNLSEDRVLATPRMDELVRDALPKHLDNVRHIVERMLRSQDPDVAEAGARLSALSAIYHPEVAALEAEAFRGSAQQRLGVARVASANIALADCRLWCESRLVSLFDDEDQEVRREAATCFRYLEKEALEGYAELIAAFCDRRAFQDDSFSILHVLEESLRKLPGMACIVCEKFLERFSDEARDVRTSRIGDAHTVTQLVFRTYQQHQQDEWTSKALDLIDRLCLEGVGDVNDAFGVFDR